MRFLIDMPLSPSLAQWLREKGHEVVHASEVGLSRANDEEVLSRARGEGRVLVTADLDYPRLLAQLGVQGPGLILFRGGNYGEAEILLLMERVLVTIPALELSDSIVVVEKRRIRRRKLPIGPMGQ